MEPFPQECCKKQKSPPNYCLASSTDSFFLKYANTSLFNSESYTDLSGPQILPRYTQLPLRFSVPCPTAVLAECLLLRIMVSAHMVIVQVGLLLVRSTHVIKANQQLNTNYMNPTYSVLGKFRGNILLCFLLNIHSKFNKAEQNFVSVSSDITHFFPFLHFSSIF